VPLDRGFRLAFYGAFAVLFATGAAWFAIDALREGPGAWAETSTTLLMFHGGAAMAVLLLLGALATLHVLPSWRSGGNRGSGSIMLALNTLLILSAYGLYYLGSETLRGWTSDAHIGLGLALPALLLLHVVLGKRGSARRRRSAAIDDRCRHTSRLP
jgi:hypothetical protein